MRITLLPLSLLAAVLASTPRSHAEITVDAFYDSLDPYGDWVEVADYGPCWQPRDVDADWRPYTLGEWVYTDAGWTWLSEEPFGWATYHYGRWLRLVGHGWVWVPDTQWGPAWVSWRDSDRYVGWAPLPPETRRIVDVGLGSWVDSYFDVGPTAYVFVDIRHFGSPRVADVVIAPRDNATIISETRNVTNVKVVNNIVMNFGPDYGAVARAADRPIRKLRLERENAELSATTRVDLKSRIEGDTVKMIAPQIPSQPSRKPRKVAQQVPAPQVDRGWHDSGPAEQTQQLREKMKAEAKAPDRLPPPTTLQAERKASPTDAPVDRPAAKRPPAPVAEPPAPDTAPPPRPVQRTESRPPTPEPQPFRESKPDGVARPKPTPRVVQPPGAEQPRVEPPRREIERPDRQRNGRPPAADIAPPPSERPKRVPQKPVTPEGFTRPPAAEKPSQPEAPAQRIEKPKAEKSEKADKPKEARRGRDEL